MTLTHADVRRILDILDHAAHLETLEVRLGDIYVRASKSGGGMSPPMLEGQRAAAPAPTAAVAVQPTKALTAESQVPEGLVAIRTPMVGTFYRRPKPGEPCFVEEGALVELGAPLCLIEAMKMFNTISAPVAGRVVRILAGDQQLAQRDAVLMLIEPEEKV